MAYVLVRLAIPPQIPVYTAFAPRNPPVISTVHQMGATVDWQRRMSMKLVGWSFLTVALSMMARADFSYTETMKGGGDVTTKHFLKGQKMKLERPDGGTILDFDAQTVTTVNNKDRTYSVTKFSDL